MQQKDAGKPKSENFIESQLILMKIIDFLLILYCGTANVGELWKLRIQVFVALFLN